MNAQANYPLSKGVHDFPPRIINKNEFGNLQKNSQLGRSKKRGNQILRNDNS